MILDVNCRCVVIFPSSMKGNNYLFRRIATLMKEASSKLLRVCVRWTLPKQISLSRTVNIWNAIDACSTHPMEHHLSKDMALSQKELPGMRSEPLSLERKKNFSLQLGCNQNNYKDVRRYHLVLLVPFQSRFQWNPLKYHCLCINQEVPNSNFDHNPLALSKSLRE